MDELDGERLNVQGYALIATKLGLESMVEHKGVSP